MADENENEINDSGNDGTFQFIIPALMAPSPDAQLRRHLRATEMQMSIDSFLDGMTQEQMYTFYRMMRYMSEVNKDACIFWSGVAATYLRKIHKACPSCGEVDHTPEEHLLGDADGQG